jgi:hypothetical protein
MPDTQEGREVLGALLHEIHLVADALVEVVQRTARLEVKVDRLVGDCEEAGRMQSRIGELEGWVRAELAARSSRAAIRGWWVGAAATIVGGSLGAIIGHLWR